MNPLASHFEDTGLRASALAGKLGVPASTISRIVRGERRPSINLARRISAETGIPVAQLRPDLFEAFAPAPAAESAA